MVSHIRIWLFTFTSSHKTSFKLYLCNIHVYYIYYSETPLIRTLMGLENCVLNRGVSLLELFILTEINVLVTDSTVLIRGVSC